ncbi:MAG: hypothetical protein IH984_16290 [Planctomycetes bacterium]|nr:hypothetical protein [Planctomycetota bacterium]
MHKRSLNSNWCSFLLAFGFTCTSYSQQCEPYWSDQFPEVGLDSVVFAMTFFDDGSANGLELYIGGVFDYSGDVMLNGIAKLDGGAWSPLGSGMSNTVRALTVFDDGSGNGSELYAAGAFSSAGGNKVNHIAKWNGKAWLALGKGLNNYVAAMIVYDDGSGKGPALYVSGSFETTGEVEASNIAKWDGMVWAHLGDGLNGPARTLSVFDDGAGAGAVLYAGGLFSTAGRVEANNIARWDGISWSAVGDGMDAQVRALEIFNDDDDGTSLYAAGNFLTAGNISASYIARWDGLQWSAVGTGTDSIVTSLAVYDDGSEQGPSLYAGGSFLNAGETKANRVAKWDGKSWSPLGSGVTGTIISLAASIGNSPVESKLYVSGLFDNAGEVYSQNFAMWDGKDWLAIGNGMHGEHTPAVVRDLEPFDDEIGDDEQLYAAGSFTSAGGIAANSIAKWNGSQWSSVGDGFSEEDSVVYDLTTFDDGTGKALYAGGIFQFAGDVSVNSIAKWDAENWSPLGAGTDGMVYALGVYDDKLGQGAALYVGGHFNTAGELPASNIAKWDGSKWSALGKGIYNNVYEFSEVWSMVVFDDGSDAGEALYVGGEFKNAGDIEASHIARWDGIQWSSVGNGLDEGENSTVYALAVFDDGNGPVLYAVGTFVHAGQTIVYGIAKWDGSNWSAGIEDGGFNAPARSVTVFEGGVNEPASLVVGGSFSTAGKVEVNAIVKFNGKIWSPLGSGLSTSEYNGDPAVWSLKEFDDNSGTGPALFAGGGFTFAGGNSSEHIAKWIICDSQIPGDLDGDGIVNEIDLVLLLSNWGMCDDCPADLDGNGSVGTSDLLILFSNWT